MHIVLDDVRHGVFTFVRPISRKGYQLSATLVLIKGGGLYLTIRSLMELPHRDALEHIVFVFETITMKATNRLIRMMKHLVYVVSVFLTVVVMAMLNEIDVFFRQKTLKRLDQLLLLRVIPDHLLNHIENRLHITDPVGFTLQDDRVLVVLMNMIDWDDLII